MIATETHKEIFKKGSKTYLNSSLFFPKSVREEIIVLYAFVKVAEDFVDDNPQRPDNFYKFRKEYINCLNGEKSDNIIISSFVELMDKRNFNPAWVEAFLISVEMDLTKSVYQNQNETLEYTYGSAEVIGLFMSRIMELPETSEYSARMLGRSLQYINFIRDIKEDNSLNRQYLPLENTRLKSLKEEEVKANSDEFIKYHNSQIEYYRKCQKKAEEGYKYIPDRYLIPIKTAADCYLWTAKQIEKDPLVVFNRKVEPSKFFILLTSIKNALLIGMFENIS